MEPNEPKKRGRPRNQPYELDRKQMKFLGHTANLTKMRDNWHVNIFEDGQKEDQPKFTFVKYTEQEAKDEAMKRIRELVAKKNNPAR